MAEINFYSYMYAQASSVAFDELTEVMDLSSPESIQRAFAAYLEDFTPPIEIKSSLLEERFYLSPNEGNGGDKTYIRYDVSIPGVDEEIDADSLKTYLEDFLDKIGAENDSDNLAEVDVELLDNERGGTDVNIYIAIGGKQISSPKKD